MAPLSVLPGRMRFENSLLVGRVEECRHLEDLLLARHGIQEISVNSRTGRILIRFDEDIISRAVIETELGNALRAAQAAGERGELSVYSNTATVPSSTAGHVILEMVLHAILPAPLDILIPAAATAFRR